MGGTRKTRARNKITSQMAAYKARMKHDGSQGSRGSTPRKSPRRKTSNPPSNVSTGVSSETKSVRKDPTDDVSRRNEEVLPGLSLLETEMVIPGTPPREMQAAGRKRPVATPILEFGSEVSQGSAEDSQRPSKKRKSYNTPPRALEVASESDSARRNAGTGDTGTSLLPQQSDQTGDEGSRHMEVLDRDLGCGTTETGRGPVEKQLGKTDDFERIRKEWAFGSKKQFNIDEDLEVLSASSEALSRLFGAFRRRMVDEVRGLRKILRTDRHENSESLKSALLTEVRDMRGVVQMLSTGNKSSSSGSSGSKTSLTEWEKLLNSLTPKAKVIFTKDVFSRILCYNAPMKVVDVYKKGIGTDTENASAAVQCLLFSLQAKARRVDFSDGSGKLHSELKYAVVQNTVYNVCKDTFDIFRSPLVGPDQASGAVLNDAANGCHRSNPRPRIARPEWLEVGYVSVDHIDAARRQVEEVNQSRKSKIRAAASPDDIASHGALRVYRLLGGHLHKGREQMRFMFFQDLGYLFVPWHKHFPDIDQPGVSLVFASDEDDCTLDLDDIPSTHVCPFAADVATANGVHSQNMTLLKEHFSEWPGLVLHVQHEVYVGSGANGQRKCEEKRKLNRLINLIEVACDVIVEYTRVGSLDLFLRSHKSALQCVMVFAFLFKQLTEEFMIMRASVVIDEEKGCVPDPMNVSVHGTVLKDFLPGSTVQETSLRRRCLSLDEKGYAKLNQPEQVTDGVTDGPSREANIALLDCTQIEESDDLGVASI